MEGDLIRINPWLKPLSWLYETGTEFRNALFDLRILKEVRFPVPVINVGNITVGGTGKTPHVEYLIRLLHSRYKVAVLSRGYKRKSKGFLLAEKDTPMEMIGDEPWLMKKKFPDIYVAVDANRRRGITQLCQNEKTKDVQVILLDDAYQHRYVKPGINILLIDYHRTITRDIVLPAGRLRENARNKKRADIAIVTKCPRKIKPMEIRVLEKALALQPYQQLYFSTICYGTMFGLFNNLEKNLEDLYASNILLLTGIGCPKQMEQDLRQYDPNIATLAFPDHHFFSMEDAEKINQTFRILPQPGLIITTEKDATRLLTLEGLSEEVKKNMYVLPIEIELLKNATTFNENITDYVHKNSGNSSLA